VKESSDGALARDARFANSDCESNQLERETILEKDQVTDLPAACDGKGKEKIMPRLLTLTLTLIVPVAMLIAARPSVGLAADPVVPAPLTTQDLSLAQAQVVLESALAAAEEQGTLMDIAVVDAGGNLKAFARMDGAWLGSIDIAATKARTARYFNLPTQELGNLSQPGGPLYGIEVSNGGLITFPGGLPLLAEDGTVIGGIGVSGSTVEDDWQVAAAAASALGGPNTNNLPPMFDKKSG
jgi:uncharacterized protein GlcG (DUF336 family)